MAEIIDINRELTVILADDGTVTWSSAAEIDRDRVLAEIRVLSKWLAAKQVQLERIHMILIGEKVPL